MVSELELLVCDGCEREVCLSCAKLPTVPEGDDPWFCSTCEEAIRRSRAVEVARAAEEAKAKAKAEAEAEKKKKKAAATAASKKKAAAAASKKGGKAAKVSVAKGSVRGEES